MQRKVGEGEMCHWKEIEGVEEMVNMERGKNDGGSTDDNSTSGYWQCAVTLTPNPSHFNSM